MNINGVTTNANGITTSVNFPAPGTFCFAAFEMNGIHTSSNYKTCYFEPPPPPTASPTASPKTCTEKDDSFNAGFGDSAYRWICNGCSMGECMNKVQGTTRNGLEANGISILPGKHNRVNPGQMKCYALYGMNSVTLKYGNAYQTCFLPPATFLERNNKTFLEREKNTTINPVKSVWISEGIKSARIMPREPFELLPF